MPKTKPKCGHIRVPNPIINWRAVCPGHWVSSEARFEAVKYPDSPKESRWEVSDIVQGQYHSVPLSTLRQCKRLAVKWARADLLEHYSTHFPEATVKFY